MDLIEEAYKYLKEHRALLRDAQSGRAETRLGMLLVEYTQCTRKRAEAAVREALARIEP